MERVRIPWVLVAVTVLAVVGCLTTKVISRNLKPECSTDCGKSKDPKPAQQESGAPSDKPGASNDVVPAANKPGLLSQDVPIPANPPLAPGNVKGDAGDARQLQGDKRVAEKPAAQKRAATPRKKAARKSRRRH